MSNFLPMMKGHTCVGGVGPLNPRLILVGESLGATEEKEGIPFVGVDGRILDQMLLRAGIKREECYITNIVKVRPPMDKIKLLPSLGLTVSDFIPILRDELDHLKPSSIIPTIISIGNVATAVLTNMGMKPSWSIDSAIHAEGILKKYRGSIYQSTFNDRYTIIPCVHPGAVREMWSLRGTVISDLKKALRVSQGGRINEVFNTIIGSTTHDISSWINLILQYCNEVSIDIEVVGSLQIACVGLGFTIAGERKSLCVPLKYGMRNYWENRDDEIFVWMQLKRIWQSSLLKITQYGWYDYSMLQPFLGEPAPPWYDLFAAHHTIDPELPHTLAYMTSIYTDINYYKDDPKDDDKTWNNMTASEILYNYNGMDCETTLLLMFKLNEDLKQMELTDFFEGFVMPKVRAIWRMSQRGILVDKRRQEILLKWKQRQLHRLMIKLNAKVGHDILATSHKQVKAYLYDELHLPIQYERKTHLPTTNEKALEKLSARYNLPQLKLILDIRGLIKAIGTYLGFTCDDRGRARGGYNPCGAETGRSSCKKFHNKTGLDLQNVPEDFRAMFIASPNKSFLKVDLWQAEFYCVSVFSQCLSFLTRLKKHQKAYPLVASWITGKPESEINVHDNRPTSDYGIAKRTSHAADYGLWPNSFATLIKQPLAIAKMILAKYHAHAPEIRTWHRSTEATLKSNGMLLTPFGRKRIFRGRFDDDTFREAYAHVPQSTIGDYLHQALMRFEYSYRPDAIIIQEGFDSIIIECDEGKEKEVSAFTQQCFEKKLYFNGEEFMIPIDTTEGKSWGKDVD